MMKRLATLAALLALSATPSFATVLLSESFTYPNGDLTPNGGWAVYSGTPPTDIQVSSGRAVVNHSNAPDDHILFPVQSTSTKTYACFDVIVPPVGGNPKAVYFFELKDNGASNLVSRVYVLAQSGGLTFGISHSSTSTTVGLTPWTAPITAGTKYNIVVTYDPVNHSSTMWVNPSSELSPSVTDVNAAIAGACGPGCRPSPELHGRHASPGPGFGFRGHAERHGFGGQHRRGHDVRRRLRAVPVHAGPAQHVGPGEADLPVVSPAAPLRSHGTPRQVERARGSAFGEIC
jgi:hypothetical protein